MPITAPDVLPIRSTIGLKRIPSSGSLLEDERDVQTREEMIAYRAELPCAREPFNTIPLDIDSARTTWQIARKMCTNRASRASRAFDSLNNGPSPKSATFVGVVSFPDDIPDTVDLSALAASHSMIPHQVERVDSDLPPSATVMFNRDVVLRRSQNQAVPTRLNSVMEQHDDVDLYCIKDLAGPDGDVKRSWRRA